MKHVYFLMVLVIIATSLANAQVGINADNSTPHPSAGLDVKFSDRGVLLPRVTFDQRNAIAGPAEGLMVFCTDCIAGGSLCAASGRNEAPVELRREGLSASRLLCPAS